jgi:hypothetical protein
LAKEFNAKRYSENYKVEVFELPLYGAKFADYGINWSAIGTVNAKETAEFRAQLVEAERKVEQINNI